MKLYKQSLIAALPLLALLSACGPELSPNNSWAADDAVQHALKTTPKVCPISDKTPDKVAIINDIDTPFVDHNRELKDFSTAFVVKEFFRSKETLFNFMKLTYETIDQELKKYREQHKLEDRAVFFLFKGGNVLRIIANQLFSVLPPEARNLLKQTYQDNFKRSDADFSVFVDESKLGSLGYETAMADLTKLTYGALNIIRAELMANPDKYFDYFQYNNRVAEKYLKNYFNKLDLLESLKNPDNKNLFSADFVQLQLLDTKANDLSCPYEGQLDYEYVFDKDDKSKIIGSPLSNTSSWIMNTINKTLEWPVENQPEKLVKFYLVRSKVQFEYTYGKDGQFVRKPVGGELIDVSFPHKDDFRLTTFLNNYDSWVADYTLKMDTSDDAFVMKAESLSGIAEDLYGVVFEQFSRPWEGAKYTKRINRLFFLAIVDMLSSFGLGSSEAKNYLDMVQQQVILPLSQLYPLSQEKAEELLENVQGLSGQTESMTTANMLWHGISKLVSDELIKNPKADDEEEFKTLLKTIKDNLAIMEKLTTMPSGKVDMSGLYKVSIDSLF